VKSNFKILLVEDMASFREAVTQLLGVYNDIEEAVDLASARVKLRVASYDVVILDKGLPDGDGIELISEIKESNPNTVIIVLTSDSDFSSVKHCIARGADDYVIKSSSVVPDLLVRIPVAVSKAASARRLENLEQLVKEAFRYEIVGKSPSTMDLRETILSLKSTNATVLITGESGTGKELIARRLNSIEDDGKRPFVAVNCGAIAESLIESELFGHKKGSFTGALHDRIGKFEFANGGDIFLDEIGELPLTLQARMLRVLQEGEVVRVGDNRAIRVNCRIIAATNQNLEKMVKTGKFREDLYHRLNVIRLETTPLRNRISDISDLAQLFTLQIGGSNFKITDRAVKALSDYEWPGNIRELRNAVERAVISARRRKTFKIDFEDILVNRIAVDSSYRLRKLEATLPSHVSELSPKGFKEFSETLLKEYFESALELTNGNVETLANNLGLGRSTAFKKMRELGIGLDRTRAFQPKPIQNRRAFSENEDVGGTA
jgi:DNA-binding NtrC family response regulator